MKALLSVSVVIVLCYVCVALLFYVFQRQLLYFPTEKYGHPFDRIGISRHGETLEVIVLNKGQNRALIYFGGNGEAVVGNASAFAAQLVNVTTYLVNYRGYGGSSGTPSEMGIYADALSIFDYLKGQHPHISVAGRSLGSAVATYLAAIRPIRRVALITPFDSALNVAKSALSFFPVTLMLKDRYDSLTRVKQIKSKVLIVAAEYDEVIPMRHTQRLRNEFDVDQVEFKIIANVGHNNLSDNADYYRILNEFF